MMKRIITIVLILAVIMVQTAKPMAKQSEQQLSDALSALLKSEKYESNLPQKAEELILKGAKKDANELNAGLRKAVNQNNNELVKWFLKQGAYDANILAEVNKNIQTEVAKKMQGAGSSNMQKLLQIKQSLSNFMQKAAPISVAASVPTVTTDARQLEFINAIASGNIVSVRNFLNQGWNINQPFTISGFKGHTPLTVALMDKVPQYEIRNNTLQLKAVKDNSANKYRVAEALIAKGADKAQLNALLAEAVANKNAVKTLWLVKNSTANADKDLLEKIKSLAASSSVADKIVWTEVVNRFEKAPATKLPVIVITSDEQKELNLFDALQKKDLEAVKRAIAAGASPKEFKHIAWMKELNAKDRQPFMWVPFDQGGYKIMDYLLSAGADKSVLNDLLFIEVHEANKQGVEWVLARITKVDPSLIAHVAQMEKEELDAAKKARYAEIKKLLEAKK